MATSQLEHKTSPIPLEEFRAGFLKPASYSEERIAKVMIEHLRRRPADLTARQKQGLERFKYDGSWSLAQPENTRDLNKFFDFFNDVYFNGVLSGYCRIDFKSFWSLRRRFGSHTLDGICQPIRPGNEIDPRFKSRNPLSTLSSPKATSGSINQQRKESKKISGFSSMKWSTQYSLYLSVDATTVVVRKP
jgi:hypothetical protein